MLFFPFRADIRLARFPILSLLICVACLFIYFKQVQSEHELAKYTKQFCQLNQSKADTSVLKNLSSSQNFHGKDICYSLFFTLNYIEDKSSFLKGMATQSAAYTQRYTAQYIEQYLNSQWLLYEKSAPFNLTNALSYKPDSYNPVTMLSSAFAHGSWSHILGNLFFFFAFAAGLEAILGIVFFPVVIVALAIGTNLVYSISVFGGSDPVATLGLSGVVMGVMGMFTYFIPQAKIRCFFWFIFIIRKFGVPAWLLALWYFGMDLYGLYMSGNESGVNLVAHVSGFIEGYLLGVLLFKWRKRQVQQILNQNG